MFYIGIGVCAVMPAFKREAERQRCAASAKGQSREAL